jgi:Protein of unknown function (DUF2971)
MNIDFSIDQLDETQIRTWKLFHPVAFERTSEAISRQLRFVHYTSADTAMRIFQGKEVWMRKSSCMNDFMEIEHGFNCLHAAYKSEKDRFTSVLEGIFPGFCAKLEGLIDGWLPHFRSDTYIACISEHGDESTGDEEDQMGRLSMWRAYGGVTGVAIVMNGGAFLRPSDALKAYASPVAYLSAADFTFEFRRLVDGFENEKGFLGAMGEDAVLDSIFHAFRYAILCTKHPGFREEREWRIIYSPTYLQSDRLISDVQSIGGTPQPIFKIPLKNVPEEGLVGIEMPELIERVIIGPTQYPVAIMEALLSLMKAAGVPDAANKIIVSDIPIRTAY